VVRAGDGLLGLRLQKPSILLIVLRECVGGGLRFLLKEFLDVILFESLQIGLS
jgi:hypothetical protein